MISVASHVRCRGEGDTIFRVLEIEGDSAALETLAGRPQGWEALSKLEPAEQFCNGKEAVFCSRLAERLEAEANARRKGLVLVVATNLETGALRTVGVSFKQGAKDPGLLLNVCPFCAERIDHGFQPKAPKQEPRRGMVYRERGFTGQRVQVKMVYPWGRGHRVHFVWAEDPDARRETSLSEFLRRFIKVEGEACGDGEGA